MKYNIRLAGVDIGEKYRSSTSIVPPFKFNNIGVIGEPGFGVGICPPDKLPSGYIPLQGTHNRFSHEYGNYFHVESASLFVYIPAIWTKIDTDGKLVYSPVSATGYGIERAFINENKEYSGILVHKYPMSISGDIMVSRPGYFPFTAIENPGAYTGGTTSLTIPVDLKSNYRSAEMMSMSIMSIFIYYLLLRLSVLSSNTVIRNPIAIDENGNDNVVVFPNQTSTLMRNGLITASNIADVSIFETLSHNNSKSGVQFSPQIQTILPGILRHEGGLYSLSTTSSIDSVTLGVISPALFSAVNPTFNIASKFYAATMLPETLTVESRSIYSLGLPALETIVPPEEELNGYGTPVFDYSLNILNQGLAISNIGDFGHTLKLPTDPVNGTIRLVEFVE